MEFIKRTEKEIGKWCENKYEEGFKGFFIQTTNESKIVEEDTIYYKNEIVFNYFKVIKQPKMYSFEKDNIFKNNIFESMLENNEIELSDSYVVHSVSYTEDEIYNHHIIGQLNSTVRKNIEIIKSFKGTSRIQNCVFVGTEVTDVNFLHELGEYLTHEWGFFDKTAPLDEQEDFAKRVIEKLKSEWSEQNGGDISNFNPNNLNDNSDSDYLSNIFRVLKTKGSTLPYL